MSSIRVKTEYQVSGAYGSTEKKTLYAKHSNGCDVVTFYDEDGEVIFSVDDTEKNNLLEAINRLYAPNKHNGDLAEGVEYVNVEESKEFKF